MPQFTFDPAPEAVRELDQLPKESPYVVFDPGDPNFAIAIVYPISRVYGAHVLRLIDHLRLVGQEPPVTLEAGKESLKRFLLTGQQT